MLARTSATETLLRSNSAWTLVGRRRGVSGGIAGACAAPVNVGQRYFDGAWVLEREEKRAMSWASCIRTRWSSTPRERDLRTMRRMVQRFCQAAALLIVCPRGIQVIASEAMRRNLGA